MCHSLDIISSTKRPPPRPQPFHKVGRADPSLAALRSSATHFIAFPMPHCSWVSALICLPLRPVNFKGAKALCVAAHCAPRSWLRTSTVATAKTYMMEERISQWIQLSFVAVRNRKILSPDPRISNSHSPVRNLSDEWHSTVQDTLYRRCEASGGGFLLLANIKYNLLLSALLCWPQPVRVRLPPIRLPK